MPVLETWLKQDLKHPVIVNRLPGNLFTGDISGNRIGVEVTDDGAPVTLSGTIRGYVIRPDGETITITNGSISGNNASIVLNADCYALSGNIRIIIKIDDVTVLACTGYVYPSTSE